MATSITIEWEEAASSPTAAAAPTVKLGSETVAQGTVNITKAQSLDIKPAEGTTLTFEYPEGAASYDAEIWEGLGEYAFSFTQNCTFKVIAHDGEKPTTTLTYNIVLPEAIQSTVLINGDGNAVSGAITVPMGTVLEIANTDPDATITVEVKSPGTNADITIDAASDPNDLLVTVNNPCTITVATASTTRLNPAPFELAINQSQVATPTFSPGAGAVASGTAVTISCATEGAAISYSTDDGATWTEGTSLTIDAATTVKAKATLTGYAPSAIATAAYTITNTHNTVYELVTSASDDGGLTIGRKYIIAYINDGTCEVMGSRAATSVTTYYPSATSGLRYDADNKKITLGDEADFIVLTLAEGTAAGRYALQLADGTYLAKQPSSSGAYSIINIGPDDTQSITTDFNITIDDDGAASIQSCKQTDRYIRWNAPAGSANRFAAYYTDTETSRTPSLYALEDNTIRLVVTSTTGGVPDTEIVDGVTFYNNAVKVTPSLQGASTFSYSTDEEDPRAWTTIEGESLTVNAPGTYRFKSDVDAAGERETTFQFRPAVPEFSTSTDPSTGAVTLSITTITDGATIEYSNDGGTTWTTYDPAAKPTYTGINQEYSVKARVTREGYFPAQVIATTSIFVKGPNLPFQLVTDASSLQAGDDIIIVATGSNSSKSWDVAMAPYAGGNNCAQVSISNDIDDKDTKPYRDTENDRIYLPDDYRGVEVVTLVKNNTYWRLLANHTEVGGDNDAYLYAAGTGSNNYLKASASPTEANANATITCTAEGVATITFQSNNSNILRYNDSSSLFSCYSSGQKDIQIYRRSSAQRAERPTVSPKEGFRSASELAGGVTLTTETVGATIWYTTDGTEPIEGVSSSFNTTGVVTGVTDGTTIRAFATSAGMSRSLTTIAAYHVFQPNRVFTRLSPEEVQNLQVNDEIIIVASPTGTTTRYAMGRLQTDQGDGDGQLQRRQAVELTNRPDANGNLVLESSQVQPIKLISGVDDYDGFNWRLYTSGTQMSGTTDEYDGYLYSSGSKNSLVTKRISDEFDPDMPNADVRFLSNRFDEIGNEYNGVTVQFGSPDGHEEEFPNYLALAWEDNKYVFNCYTLEQLEADGADRWHVSIFKAYDPSAVATPAYYPIDHTIAVDDEITISTITPDATIRYIVSDHQIDDITTATDGWTLYTAPIVMNTRGTWWVYAYATADGLTESPINERSYRVARDEVFELVKSDTEIKENDRIIIVSAIPYADPRRTDDPTTERLYAMAKERVTGNNPYHMVTEVERVEVSAGELPRVLVIDGSDVAVMTVQKDGTGLVADRPWLLQHEGQYLKAYLAKSADFVDLPTEDEWTQRASFSANVWVDDWDNQNITYGTPSLNGNAYTYSGAEKGTMADAAHVVISATAFDDDGAIDEANTQVLHARFNPVGKVAHINFFVKDNEASIGSTYPVHIYRATENVLPPSLTVYPMDMSSTAGDIRYSDDALSGHVENFNNPVKIEIKEHPKSNRNARLLYSWGEAALTAGEYTAAGDEVKAVTVYLDGFAATLNGVAVDVEALKSTEGAWLRTAIRAMSQLGEGDDAHVSRSNPRHINFRTVAPMIAPNDSRTRLTIGRPQNNWTLGATLRYTTDGSIPTATTGTPLTLTDGEATIDITPADIVTVGAFKDGYEPSFTTYKQYSHYPEGHPTQVVELTAAGSAIANPEGSGHVYRYMTVCADEDRFYLLDEDAEGTLSVAPIDQATAIGVMQSPDNFNWTADYFVIGLDEVALRSAVEAAGASVGNIAVDIEGESAQRLIYNAGGEEHIGYGAWLKRRGSLGTDKITTTLTYDVTVGEEEPTSYVTSTSPSITPMITLPYDLNYTYRTVRDTPDGYTRDDHFRFATISSIPDIIAPYRVDEDYEPLEGESLTRVPEAESFVYYKNFNNLKFDKDQFTLRHVDCVFEFTRPNVCKDIIDNYDIVYDVTLHTDDPNLDDLRGLFADPTRTAPDHDVDTPNYTYRFVVRDVTPNMYFNPTLTINSVIYVPNGDNDGYSRLIANYPRFNEGVDPRTGVAQSKTYDNALTGENLNSVSAPVFNFDIAYINRDAGAEHVTDWVISRHLDSTVDPTVDINDEARLEAPFMYQVEAWLPGHADTYIPHEWLVEHNPKACKEGTDLDPFGGIIIGSGYPRYSESNAQSYTSYPDVYVTPIYFFARNPQPSVEEEGNLEVYVDETQPNPQAVRRRVSSTSDTGVYDENNPLIIRGSQSALFSVSDWMATNTPTGIEDVAYDQPTPDVEYYTLGGVKLRGFDRLPAGVYVRRQGSAAAKVLVK